MARHFNPAARAGRWAAALLGAAATLSGCAWESDGSAVKPPPPPADAGANTGAAKMDDIVREVRDIPDLLCLFGEARPAAWAQARRGLREIGSPLVHPDTLRLVDLTEKQSAPEAERARRALARLGTIFKQLALLDRRASPETWDQVRASLIQMGPDATEQFAFYLLRRLGRRDSDSLDRTRHTLASLGKSGLPLIRAFLESGQTRASARTQALMTLLEMKPAVREDVDAHARSADPARRYCAATALKADPDRDHAVPLLMRLAGDASWATRAEAVIALGSLGDARAIPAAGAALADSDALVRTKAVEALGRLGATSAVPKIIALMNDPGATPEFRDAAADALRRLTGERFGPNPGAWHAWLLDPSRPSR